MGTLLVALSRVWQTTIETSSLRGTMMNHSFVAQDTCWQLFDMGVEGALRRTFSVRNYLERQARVCGGLWPNAGRYCNENPMKSQS
jgi:hypothetical protein